MFMDNEFMLFKKENNALPLDWRQWCDNIHYY